MAWETQRKTVLKICNLEPEREPEVPLHTKKLDPRKQCVLVFQLREVLRLIAVSLNSTFTGSYLCVYHGWTLTGEGVTFTFATLAGTNMQLWYPGNTRTPVCARINAMRSLKTVV